MVFATSTAGNWFFFGSILVSLFLLLFITGIVCAILQKFGAKEGDAVLFGFLVGFLFGFVIFPFLAYDFAVYIGLRYEDFPHLPKFWN